MTLHVKLGTSVTFDDGGRHPDGGPTNHSQKLVIEDLASHAKSLLHTRSKPAPKRIAARLPNEIADHDPRLRRSVMVSVSASI